MYVLPLILSLGVSFESMLFTANQWLGLGYCDGNQMSVSFSISQRSVSWMIQTVWSAYLMPRATPSVVSVREALNWGLMESVQPRAQLVSLVAVVTLAVSLESS